MSLERLAHWIDRRWDEGSPQTGGSLACLCLIVWAPLMLVGWNPVTTSIAWFWGALWIGLYAWRFPAFVRRTEAWTSRARKRWKNK